MDKIVTVKRAGQLLNEQENSEPTIINHLTNRVKDLESQVKELEDTIRQLKGWTSEFKFGKGKQEGDE